MIQGWMNANLNSHNIASLDDNKKNNPLEIDEKHERLNNVQNRESSPSFRVSEIERESMM
jgi:hypothetical protein